MAWVGLSYVPLCRIILNDHRYAHDFFFNVFLIGQRQKFNLEVKKLWTWWWYDEWSMPCLPCLWHLSGSPVLLPASWLFGGLGFDLWPTSVATLFRNSELPQKHAETTKNKDTVSCDKTTWNNLGIGEQPPAAVERTFSSFSSARARICYVNVLLRHSEWIVLFYSTPHHITSHRKTRQDTVRKTMQNHHHRS